MANPSLKAKIEAAKSALEEGQNNAPLNRERDDPVAPKTSLNSTPLSESPNPSINETPTTFQSDATTLDARITRLESKLAENQRDLYTLLGKIREVTRLQNNAAKNNRLKNSVPEGISSGLQNKNGQTGRKIHITLAVLTGIILGASFFFTSNFIDQHLVHLHTWTLQFIDFINDFVR